jgi:hypothetical protein
VNRSVFSFEALQKPSACVAFCVVVLSCFLYARFLSLPFLPDDYLQITLARSLGPLNQWGHIFDDTLFRSRATSLLITYWTDLLFPLSPVAYGTSSILLHALNGLLVYALGTARSIGWQLSALTAIVFAVQERPHEAIVWYASIPELLVFTFILITLLLWIRWLHAGGIALALWTPMLISFVLALLSKESAIVAIALMVLVAFIEKAPLQRATRGLTLFIVIAGFYVIWVLGGKESNHHFYDGTFVAQAGFMKTAALSAARGLWVWGWVAILILLWFRIRQRALAAVALFWMFASLLPYSFLTYMRTVPSRHHYLAAVGCSLIIAIAMRTLHERTRRSRIVVWCVLVIGLHHGLYLWTAKYRQFERRAEPIETFLHFLSNEPRRPIFIYCSDYLFSEIQRAAHLRRGEPEEHFVLDLARTNGDGPSYCLPKV